MHVLVEKNVVRSMDLFNSPSESKQHCVPLEDLVLTNFTQQSTPAAIHCLPGQRSAVSASRIRMRL